MFWEREPTLLEREIDRAIRELKRHVVGSAEYDATLERITKLYRLKEEEKSNVVSKDTLAVVGANLLGILMIIKHEYVNVITSRAINLLLKPIIRA